MLGKFCLNALLAAVCFSAAHLAAGDINVDFSEGKWDKSLWTDLRVLPVKAQAAAPEKINSFSQEKNCVAAEFTKEHLSAGDDNTLMIMDTGKNTGEIALEFEADGGSGTAPGICVFPSYSGDKTLERCIAIFTASYTVAVWDMEIDQAGRVSKYKHLARLARWSDPSQRHTLRCRFSKADFAVSIDGSDPMVFRVQPWVPAPKEPSKDDIQPNGKIGVWGCHGKCKFYSLKVLERPEMPTAGKKPAEPAK
jgi:hypothetical protein